MDQNQIITMTSKEARRYGIIKDLLVKKIDGAEAAKQLNLSVRQTKRLKAAVNRFGIKGIIHGNRGQNSHNKIDPKVLKKLKNF